MRKVGRYVVLSRIASGALGDVFLARRDEDEEDATLANSPEHEHQLALKLVRAELARDLRFTRLLLTEAATATRFFHPVAASVLEADRLGPDLFVAMTLEHGQALSSVLKRAQMSQAPLDPRLLLAVGAQVASCLAKAHATPWFVGAPQGIVHGGISPRSVFLTYEGRVRLLGLGLGRARLAVPPSPARLPYFPPELLLDREVTPRVDVYSLAVVLYDALTQRHVFRRATEEETRAAIREARVAPLNAAALRIGGEVSDLLRDMMAPRPEARPEDMGAIEQLLRRAAAGTEEELTRALEQRMQELFAPEMRAEKRVVAAASRQPRPPSAVAKDAADTLEVRTVPEEREPLVPAVSAPPKVEESSPPPAPPAAGAPAARPAEGVWTEDLALPDPEDIQRAVSAEPAPARGQADASTQDVALRRRVARYQTQELVKRGASAVLFRARDPNVSRNVLLKVMDPDYITDPRLRKEEWLGLFKREARLAGRVGHALLPTLLDAGRDGTAYFLAYQWIEGESLADLLARGEALSPERIRAIAADLARALDHLHEHDLVHCDVRASNVVIDPLGRAHLVDFSMTSDATGPEHPLLAANVHVHAPEYLLGYGYGPRSDQFALGALVYQMLVGARPFQALDDAELSRAIQQKSPRPPEAIDPALDAELSRLAMRLLEKDPVLRFESCAALAETLEGTPARAAGSALGAASPEITSERTTEPVLPRQAPVVSQECEVVVIDDNVDGSLTLEILSRSGVHAALFQDLGQALEQVRAHLPRLVVVARGAGLEPALVRRHVHEISRDVEVRFVPDAASRLLGASLSADDLARAIAELYGRVAAIRPFADHAVAQLAQQLARRLTLTLRTEQLVTLAAGARDLAGRLRLASSAEEILRFVPAEVESLLLEAEQVVYGPAAEGRGRGVAAHVVAVADAYVALTQPGDDRQRVSPRRALLELRGGGERFRPEVLEALVAHLREQISALDLGTAETPVTHSAEVPRALVAGSLAAGPLTQVLVDLGFAVDTADNGHVAWEKLRREPYRLAVLDERLPARDGLSLLNLCRNHPDTRGVAVFLVTERKDDGLAAEVSELGGAVVERARAVDAILQWAHAAEGSLSPWELSV